jgi:hypothetical protein
LYKLKFNLKKFSLLKQMDKLNWIPPSKDVDEIESTLVASDFPPPGVDSEGSSYHNNNNADNWGDMDDGVATMMEESMEHDQEDEPPLGSDDEEQV